VTLRRTASIGRALWYGSLLAGGLIGGTAALTLTLRLTRPKESL
jgi:hypothetical protein